MNNSIPQEKEPVSGRSSMINASKVRSIIKDEGCMISPEALEEFIIRSEHLLRQAIERTKANKRTTVRPYDF
jgi:DNA polymerase III delta prime subunit